MELNEGIGPDTDCAGTETHSHDLARTRVGAGPTLPGLHAERSRRVALMARSMRPTRDELVDRLAQVSHATYLLQAIRDQDKRLVDITPPPKETFEETSERMRDIETAEAWLQAVLDGRTLNEFSGRPGHLPTDHDRERAENSVQELIRLGLLDEEAVE
jgi:hypothetical protein